MSPSRIGLAGGFRVLLALAVVGCPLSFPVPLWAESPHRTGTAATVGEVEIRADRLEYEAGRDLLVGIGNVVVRKGNEELRADCISVNTRTHDAYATGNVVFQRGRSIWRGEELSYNFKTGIGDFGAFNAYVEPYYIRAADSQRVSPEEYVLTDVIITTCESERPDFFIRASSARIFGEERLRARNVVVFLGPIPILYLPLWSQKLHREKTNLDVVPGYSSKMGYFVLTAYNYRLSPSVRGATRLDYRSRRGVGVGQDLWWQSATGGWSGKLQAYHTSDDKPYENDEQEEEDLGLVDSSRYRIKLEHRHQLTPRDYVVVEGHYLSDPDVLEDFFNKEFRHTRQPENRVTIRHRGDYFTAGLQLNARLNDFYENVDRLPEVTVDIPQQVIPGTPFYLQAENSVAYLRKVHPDYSDRSDYDALRADSHPVISYPTRHFGFLNVIPEIGGRLTWYSASRQERSVTNPVAVTTTNVEGGVTSVVESVSNQVDTVVEDAGAVTRTMIELGLEASFKAFRELVPPARSAGGLRHVAEPYARYTYVPEPSVTEDELYQFDRIDRLGKEHHLRLGMRNKLQTKRWGRIEDLMDADVSVLYRIEKERDQDSLGPLDFAVELSPARWFFCDFDGRYDLNDSELDRLNLSATMRHVWVGDAGVEYVYRRDRRNLLGASVNLFPRADWSLSTYWRYDFDDQRLEEQSYYIQHKTECLGLGIGYEGRGDEWTIWARIWLLAFPESIIELGR